MNVICLKAYGYVCSNINYEKLILHENVEEHSNSHNGPTAPITTQTLSQVHRLGVKET